MISMKFQVTLEKPYLNPTALRKGGEVGFYPSLPYRKDRAASRWYKYREGRR